MAHYEEEETPHVKSSRRVTPPKADHRHEYFRVVTMAQLRGLGGVVTEEKHRVALPAACIACGHKLRTATKLIEEIEVSPREFNQLAKNSH